MLVGHYGIGFGLKRLNTGINLAVLFAAVQLVDIAWAILLLLGVEKVLIEPGITKASPLAFVYYPFTHSLVAFVIWAILGFAAFMFLPFKYFGQKLAAGVIIAIGVFSHFILDLIVHIPDIPVASEGSHKMGLGLWNNVALSLIVELAIFFGGLALYMTSTKGRTFWQKYGVVIFVVVMAIFQIFGPFSPPPSNTTQIGIFSLIIYTLAIVFAFIIDRSRQPRLQGRGQNQRAI